MIHPSMVETATWIILHLIIIATALALPVGLWWWLHSKPFDWDEEPWTTTERLNERKTHL